MTGPTSPSGAGSTLVVNRLTKSYRTATVLDDVSFTLHPGTATVIGGINGIGKSTLLRCLAGLARFDGSVQLGGEAIHRRIGAATRRRISYLPQSPGLPENGTVAEIVDLYRRLRPGTDEAATFPDDFLPPADHRLRILSGGQQQRVALTIAMLGRPDLLLLDEPTANLDHAARTAVWKAIRTATERGAIVAIASPAPAELDEVADRVIELEAGTVSNDEWRSTQQGLAS